LERGVTDDYRFFKTLTDQVITVELKNDLSITGTLKSVDQYVCLLTSVDADTSSVLPPRGTEADIDAEADDRFLNIRLDGIQVDDPERHPHMVSPLLPIPLDHACLKS